MNKATNTQRNGGKDHSTDTPILSESVREPEADKDAAEEIVEKGEPAGGGNFA